MNILVSTPTFLPVVGGAELGIHEIYDRLGKRHRVTVITPDPGPRAIAAYGADDYRDASYDVHYLGSTLARIRPAVAGKALKRTSLPYISAIRRVVAAYPVDVVNFHYIAPHGAAMLYVRRLLRIPVAVSLVGRTDVARHLSVHKRLYARVALSAAHAVLPISKYYYPDLDQNGSNIFTIPYGVDTRQFSPNRRSEGLRKELGLDQDDFVLLAVQRLSRIKRVDIVIRALGEILKQHFNAALIIVGQGEERPHLERLARELGLTAHVKFAGYVSSSDLPRYFASADAFAFHSMFETFGIVFAQAMASGLPIIAADTSCVPHVVQPENGILVPPNDLQAFKRAAMRLIGDPVLREEMGRRNRHRACREFDWDLIASAYEEALLCISTGPEA